MTHGLVTTIIPVHNRPAQLREAVESVLAQDYRPIEIIIVDDGSTDETYAAAQALAAEHPGIIRAETQTNAGPGMARERGRRLARGEFIQYLDSDDVLLPGKFSLQVAGLRANPECGVAYGKTHFCIDGTLGERSAWKRTGERIYSMFPSFLESRWWGTSTPLYSRVATDAAGAWLGLSSEEDWEYDCRIAGQGTLLVYVDEFVSEEHEHAGLRLSRGGSVLPNKLRDRADAHALILGHALRAHIGPEVPEMQHFSRELFLLSRQCGAAGLAAESRRLFELSRQASGVARSRGLDFRLYKMAASILGWVAMGRLSGWLDKARG